MNNSLPDFLLIPTVLIQDKNLKPTDLLVYGAIYWYTRLKMERCIASNKTLALVAGCEFRTVPNAIMRLKAGGYIEVRMDSLNHREEIIPLVSFAQNSLTPSSNNEWGSSNNEGGVRQITKAPSSNDEHNKNIKEEEKKNTSHVGSRGVSKATEEQGDNKTAENKRLLSLQAQTVFDCWVQSGPIKHASLNEKMTTQILKRLKEGYTPDQINTAILNYAEILESPDSFFKYKWTLADFIARGLEKFLDRDIAKSNFIRKQSGGVLFVE